MTRVDQRGTVKLQTLNNLIDWDFLVGQIYPYYVQSDMQPLSTTIESMLRVYCLQKNYQMSSEKVVETLKQDESAISFSLINLEFEEIPSSECIDAFNELVLECSLDLKVEQAFLGK